MSGDRYYITDQNAIYFLTFTTIDWVDIFTKKEYKLELVDSMNYCIKEKGLIVYGWVIMSNHMHAIWQAREGYNLSSTIRDFKEFTAKRIISMIKDGDESRKVWMLKKFEFAGKRLNRISKYKFWKDSNHAVYLGPEDTKMKEQKLNYIHNNPVKAMLVHTAEDYIFSSAADYAGDKGLVEVTLLQ
ncbi:MAG TPA: transposase [Bacteroidetes bacterium]|nr:MAG: transposase [Bacteroidota bacterium]RLD88042.1 MAG: transposase [Bacteroidota bacterium]HHL57552.1 transposase [Bacteroidota bacterium]